MNKVAQCLSFPRWKRGGAACSPLPAHTSLFRNALKDRHQRAGGACGVASLQAVSGLCCVKAVSLLIMSYCSWLGCRYRLAALYTALR